MVSVEGGQAIAFLLRNGPASFAGTMFLLIVSCVVPWWLVGDVGDSLHVFLLHLVLPPGVILISAIVFFVFHAFVDRPAPVWVYLAVAMLQVLLAVWCNASISV